MTKRRIPREDKLGEYIEKVMPSGIEILIRPFPIGLHERVLREGLKKFPDIIPPLREIDSFGDEEGKEKEKVEDLENPDYIKEQEQAEINRNTFVSEKLLEFILKLCIEVDEEKQEETITILESTLEEKFPEDKVERRREYLLAYVLRTKDDYVNLLLDTLSLSVTGSAEVAERLDSFQHTVEQEASNESSSDSSSV